MTCTHEGPCGIAWGSGQCALVQRANARKYDPNQVWNFQELEPGIFALYNPIQRELVALGSIDEVLAVYRARTPYVHRPRPVAPKGIDLGKLEFTL